MSHSSEAVQTGLERVTDADSSDTHVCFICPYIYGYLKPGSRKTVGGAERQQHLLATSLQETGYDVSFITFVDGGDAHERIDGFDVWKTLPPTNNIKQAPNVLFKLFRSIQRVDADVFYVRGNPPLCILSSYCCAVLGETFVYCVANDSNIELARLPDHHGMFQYTVPKLAYVDAIRRSDAVVAQTEYQQNILENVLGIRSDIVPNVYSVPPQDDLVEMSDRSFVLWVGSLDPEQKKPMRFVRLAEQLPAVEFVLIGWSQDETFRTRISNQADSLSNLRFEGFVPPDEIDRYYRRAAMFVNTSEYEGFPNTFLEAWRFGVPVVSLHHTLDGLLSERDIGLHSGSVDRLTQQVERLWENPETAAELGHNGREYLRTHYSVDIAFEKYTQLFAAACD
jgi:glycosyltransferase involved in cell wall biosynthesis